MIVLSTYTMEYTFSRGGVTIENKMICLTVFQPNGLNNVAEHSKTSTPRLLETIERVTQTMQTPPKQQTQEVFPCRPSLLDHHVEKHF